MKRPMNSIQAGVSEFADVIGKTGGKAMPIGPGNRMDGWVPVGEAIATGQCFAVDVAPEIVACDFDLGDLTQVDDCVGALKELGLNPVICASGGANRRHIFVRCESAEIQALVRSMAKGFGADVRKTIRPLLSPHRQSGHSELLEPKDPDLALRFLSGTIDTPNGTKLLLPSTVLQRLQFGDLDGRYASRSELIQAITNAAYEWVWDFEALFLLLMDTENVAGEKIREKEARYRGSGRSYLEGSWGKAALYVPKSPKELKGENVVPLAALLRELTVRMPELSTMEVVVLEAHLEIVGRAKSTSYTLSTRQAAELAGCNKETARIVSRGLAGKGYLTRTAPSNGMEASTWSIHLDNFRTYSSSTTYITYIGGGCD